LWTVYKTSGFVLCVDICTDKPPSRRTMSVLCRTLTLCVACHVASYHCTSTAAVNHAINVQLDALQCTSRMPSPRYI